MLFLEFLERRRKSGRRSRRLGHGTATETKRI